MEELMLEIAEERFLLKNKIEKNNV